MISIKVRKGLDIPIIGKPENVDLGNYTPYSAVVYPDDFNVPGLGLRLLVYEKDKVRVGTPIFEDKKIPELKIVSMVSGEVVEINRGEKRKLLNIRILADKEQDYEEIIPPDNLDIIEIAKWLLKSGLWVWFEQRPFGIIPTPYYKPRDIYVMCGDTAPHAPSFEFVFGNYYKYIVPAIELLTYITDGNIYIVFSNVLKNKEQKRLCDELNNLLQNRRIKEKLQFISMDGPHPACTLSVAINKIQPVNKGEIVWGIKLHGIIQIGYAFLEKRLLNTIKIALTGEGFSKNGYVATYLTGEIEQILRNFLKSDKEYRVISGNVLTGKQVDPKGAIHYYDLQLSAIPEGKEPEFMGWLIPSLSKFSNSRLVPSYFIHKITGKEFSFTTNTNGEERPFVITGEYERVFPLDYIPPQEFIKYCIAGDLDTVEELGGLEVAPEDFALCEFVCTSKVPLQSIVRKTLTTLYKESQ